MKVNLMLIFTLVFIIACQKTTENNVKQKAVVSSAVKSECNITSKFNANDSVGEFTGLIKRFEDTTTVVSVCHVILLDGSGDSTDFILYYSEVKNFTKEKMTSGSCVTVKYIAEIDREEGIEISRAFYVTDIKYK